MTAPNAHAPFEVRSLEQGVTWTVTGIKASDTPCRIWIELEHREDDQAAVAALLDSLGIPRNS